MPRQLPQYQVPNLDFNFVGMMQQAKQLQDMQDQSTDRRVMEEVSRQFPDDPDKFIAELGRRGKPQLAMGFQKQLNESRKSAAESMGQNLDNQLKRFTMASSIASGIKDEPTFQQGKMQIAELLGPDLAQHLGDVYDPSRIEQAVAWGSTESGRLAAQKQASEDYLAVLNAQQEGREKEPETFGKWVSAYGNTMSVARNPDEWAQLRRMAQQSGTPAPVLEMLPEQFSPDLPEMAAGLAMTAKERASLKGDQAALGQRKAEADENARANRSREANAAAELAFRREDAEADRALAREKEDKKVAVPTGGAVQEIMSRVEHLVKQINTDEGLWARGTGIVKAAGAATGYNNDLAEYNALIEGAIPLMARQMGHTGVLTQQDVDSVRALFPQPGEGKALSQRKVQQVKDLLASQAAGMATPAAPASRNPFRD